MTYVFNTLTINPSQQDMDIAHAMMASWAALARSGDPNASALGIPWSSYDAARDNDLDFGVTVTAGEGLRTQKCDMWDARVAP